MPEASLSRQKPAKGSSFSSVYTFPLILRGGGTKVLAPPRTPVNKGKNKGRAPGVATQPSPCP
jgi:hypothetical protein